MSRTYNVIDQTVTFEPPNFWAEYMDPATRARPSALRRYRWEGAVGVEGKVLGGPPGLA